MSAALESRAEIAKLARLLEIEAESLGELERVAPEDLRLLREQATDVLFEADRGALQRMAAASRVIPVPVLAKIAEGVFGPLLCARIAGLIDPQRAVDIAARLETSFLADVAVLLDPRRVTEVIAGMPVAQTVAVATELMARGEFVTMGRFVGHLSDDALRASVALADETALLRIAFVLEGKERLPDVLALLSRERIAAMIDVAAREDLWPEVLDLLNNVNGAGAAAPASDADPSGPLATLAAVAAELDVAVLERAAQAATDHGLWRPLLELAVLMDTAGRQRVAAVILTAPPTIAESLFDAVAADQLWAELLVLAGALDEGTLEALALRGAARLDLAALVGSAERDARLWEPGLRLLAGLDSAVQMELVERAAELSDERRALIGEHAKRLGLEDQLELLARVAR